MNFGGIIMNPNKSNNDCNVKLDTPYPPVQAKNKCKEYAYAMLSNIGSSNSEMSAISLYFYNSVILDNEYADFAKCFHSISIVEMHHLDIFAKLAYQMGLDPRLWSLKNNKKFYWTPSYNCYPKEIRKVIENSINGEKDAIKKYTSQAKIIKDANIVENLERIIIDEKHHIEIFDTMLEKI